MKIKALPFIAGSAGYAYFISGDWTVTAVSSFILGILVITGQVDLY